MTTDLFQIITLAGLGLLLILGLVGLNLLSNIRKSLPGGGGARAAESRGAEPRGAETRAAAPAQEAAPAYQAPAAAYQAPVGQTTAQTAPQPAVESHPLEHATQTPAAEPAPAATPTPTPATAAPEPQDEPFERGGRWWFRRGNELLVYDEGTGQWQPAPAADAAALGLTSGGGTAAQPSGGVAATGAAPTGDTGEGWKCPTCGAINASSATSCRMCFTARP